MQYAAGVLYFDKSVIKVEGNLKVSRGGQLQMHIVSLYTIIFNTKGQKYKGNVSVRSYECKTSQIHAYFFHNLKIGREDSVHKKTSHNAPGHYPIG